jgi:hypothetical protein
MSPAPAFARHARPRDRAARLLALVATLVALGAPEAAATSAPEADVPLERAVKAAFVYNFTRFVSWPAESLLARAPVFTIGVLGDDPLADAIEAAVRDREAGGRPFDIRRFRAAEDVVPCPVLYVGRERSGRLRPLLEHLRGWPVLTVGDGEGFTSEGGAIGLFLEDNRVRFEVSVLAAQAAGLQVSSKLLRLSRPAPLRPCPACVVDPGGER